MCLTWSDLGFVPGEVLFLYSAGPIMHHCMDYRFEPMESRLQRGEVPSLIWLLSLKIINAGGGGRRIASNEKCRFATFYFAACGATAVGGGG